ncbi:hypothetical protein MMC12_000705 [Toensbergia leucococca]|nr:hypothetical protein [Toensbergia leucococca]
MVATKALSMLILLDQLPRNIFRDTSSSRVFEHYDRLALALSLSLVKDPIVSNNSPDGWHHRLDLHPSIRLYPVFRIWYYMPLMHSEYLPDHSVFQALMSSLVDDVQQAQDEGAVQYAQYTQNFGIQHVEIIEKFGRYPHRNTVLGRPWTQQERAWVDAGGSTFGSKM